MTATKISVSPEVKATLPDVLIDWLCKLAVSDEYRQNPVQTFTLSPGELGGQSVQDIRYVDKQRCVFGFPPVSCKLQVRGCNDQYQMVLAN